MEKVAGLRGFLLVLLLFVSFPAYAAEVIHNYTSRIEIRQDGTLQITETIEVTAEGNEIRRGIYRDLPLYRRTFLGGILDTDYVIESVKKDGVDEPWHMDHDTENGHKRIYIGDSGVFLENGRYTYEISYHIDNQVFFFDDYDELYWNAISTAWSFPIERGQIEITLPEGAEVKQFSAYTGKAMSRAQNYTAEQKGSALYLQTTKPLAPYEGVTVAVGFTKGIITAPSNMTGMAFFWRQHPGLPVALLFLLALSAYYYVTWKLYGVDPKRRGLAPFYDAPRGVSPAMAAMIHTMGDANTDKCLTAAIVSLAAQNYLSITEEKKGAYTITRADQYPDTSLLSEDEKLVFDELGTRVTIDNASQPLVGLPSKLSSKLNTLCHERYYLTNGGRWGIGIAIFLMALLVLGIQNNNQEMFILGTVFTLLFGGASLSAMIYGIKQLFTSGGAKGKALFLMIWASGFSIGGFLGIGILAQHNSWLVIGIIMLMAAIVVKMRHIMKAPTREGRAVMDHINGLKYYMEAVEEKVLKKLDPPQMSRELYEKYLPYAVALDVESKWADKFAAAAGAAAVVAGTAMATSPRWYHGASGASGNFSVGGMVSSLSSGIAAASTSPSSSSSGGGSSGGGGGGGGGGGW